MVMRRKIWLLGQPLEHSLSPSFQNAGLRHLNLPLEYERHPVALAELPEVVMQVRCGEIAGANVTLPWKEAVARWVDRLSPAAARAGAVNTLVRAADGAVEGHNTDVPGLRRALVEQGFGPGQVRRAAVLGAGGAARAAVVALDQLGVEEIVLLNRSYERAAALAEALRPHNCATLVVAPLERLEEPSRLGALSSVELLIHATSLAVGAAEDSEPFAQAVERWDALPWDALSALRGVHDLCYGITDTPFLQAARRNGVPGVDGAQMLLYQGMLAFLLWTRHEAPEAVMRAALAQARARRARP